MKDLQKNGKEGSKRLHEIQLLLSVKMKFFELVYRCRKQALADASCRAVYRIQCKHHMKSFDLFQIFRFKQS